ncbi:hypothetical protein OS493_010435 [Desmophyllum pertusum]|uniref:Protein kinase domain-containing protein n=1 Tax=Desmophyllum pertusum TaxID=174260 RepID=A0A9X0A3I4_9CNID|nr:hypothetical protein OS493_010435 [Desmophyllum pertusum]
MAETSADYLDDVTNESVLKLFVKDQLKEANLSLKQIEARIPELIQADKMLCKELGEETRSKKEIQESYQPILDEASRVRGHLAVFGLKELRALDISSEELEWKEDMSCQLGSGAFATVYQGKMRRHGKEQPVALKVCKELLDATNATLNMAEVELLRKLEHPHIVQFLWHITPQEIWHHKSDPGHGKVQRKLEESHLWSSRISSCKVCCSG